MNMEKFFYPESIAVIGVSDSPSNLGRTIVENLERFRYSGRVYGVGRTEKEVAGKRVYRSIEDLPATPDLAVFLIPARAVPESLERCGKRGVRHAVIETGGFSELGGEGTRLTRDIVRIALEWNITFMGPNCVGIINMENGVCLPFVPFALEEVVKGANSFVSQSGGLIHELIRRTSVENVGLCKMASIGNKLRLDENDVVEFFIDDTSTHNIGIYLESVADGRRLMELASRTTKPLIVLKGNTNPASRNIAQFHTAALLGDDAVATAAFRQAGLHRVSSLEEMVECFKIFSLPLMKGPNLFAISRSGGQSVVFADQAHRYGFLLPEVPRSVVEQVKKEVKAGVIRSTNPLDMGDVFNDLFYLDVVEMALREANIDGVAFFYDYPYSDIDLPYAILKGSERLSHLYQKPVLLCMTPDKTDWFKLKYSRPFPFFNEPERAFSALRRSLDHHLRTSKTRKGAVWGVARPVTEPADSRQGLATAAEAFSLLQAYGVPVAKYALVRTFQEAREAVQEIGYPVALKKAEPIILHKTEAGAVRLGIGNDEELKEAFDAVPADLYLLQKMAPPGVETIVGGKRDPEFGPVVVFGLGGIFVETLKDITVRVAPIDEETSREMTEEIRGAPLLRGARGTSRSDVQSLAAALTNVSRLLADHPEIVSLDINPLRVLPEGAGCQALDVKIEMTKP